MNGTEYFRGLTGFHRKEFLHFRLSTLTKEGYGEITSVASAALTLFNLEALMGQLYPLLLIARFVNRFLDWPRSEWVDRLPNPRSS
jgi:hypothetical protein